MQFGVRVYKNLRDSLETYHQLHIPKRGPTWHNAASGYVTGPKHTVRRRAPESHSDTGLLLLQAGSEGKVLNEGTETATASWQKAKCNPDTFPEDPLAENSQDSFTISMTLPLATEFQDKKVFRVGRSESCLHLLLPSFVTNGSGS